MVKSLIDDSITYIGTDAVDESDFGYDAVQFDIELFPNIMAGIALGNVRYTYADKGILYIPVYIVKDESVVEQIGIYEFLASQYTQLLDEDDDFDVSLMTNPLPLYYDFFTQKHLEKLLGTQQLEDDDIDVDLSKDESMTKDPLVVGFDLVQITRLF
jgi:hypothetical protein